MIRRFPWVALVTVPLVMVACGDDEVEPNGPTGGVAGKQGNGGAGGAKAGASSGGDAGQSKGGGSSTPTAGTSDGGGEGGAIDAAGAGGAPEPGVSGSAGKVGTAGTGGTSNDTGDGGYAGALDGGTGGAPGPDDEAGGSGGADDGPTEPTPTNHLANPGFEEGWADGWTLDNPGGLSSWQISVKEDSSKARTGTKYLNIYFAPGTAYEALASQVVTNLEDGYYKFSMFCQRNPFTELSLFAVGFDESNPLEEATVAITTGAWPFAEVSIPSIHVTSGQVEVGIYAESDGADTYAECDDAELIAVEAPE